MKNAEMAVLIHSLVQKCAQDLHLLPPVSLLTNVFQIIVQTEEA